MIERYNKFLVEKRSDVEKYLTFDQQIELQGLLQLIAAGRERDGKSNKNYVSVADNWPMYETVWSMIEAFVDNKPNEIESLRQQLAEAKKITETEKAATDAAVLTIKALKAQLAECQKDAGRLDFMIEHTDSVFKTGDGRYVVEYSVNEFNYHAYAATSREAIDAALEAEGRKE